MRGNSRGSRCRVDTGSTLGHPACRRTACGESESIYSTTEPETSCSFPAGWVGWVVHAAGAVSRAAAVKMVVQAEVVVQAAAMVVQAARAAEVGPQAADWRRRRRPSRVPR